MLGATACHLGLTAHCVFTWKVFRPRAGWARAVVGASVATVLVGFAGNFQVGFRGAATMEEVAAWTFFLMIVATASYGWSAVESFAYHAKLRKRLALGLSEPVIVNRFLLWGTSGAASTLSCVVNGYYVLTSPLSALDPRALVVSGVCGAIGGAVMILTFLPPASYLRFVEARHAARTA